MIEIKRLPRDYQVACVDAVARTINSGYRQLYYALPTGCGKTRIMTMLVELYMRAGRVLVIAHRKELIEQTAQSIRDDIPDADVGIVMAEQNQTWRDIIVGTWQSLTPTRLEAVLSAVSTDRDAESPDYACRPFSLILFDESHHAIAGSAYEHIMLQVQQHSPLVATVGCTATPFRSDKTSMQEVLPECAFLKTIPEMQQTGWLAPLYWKAIKLNMALPTTYSSVDGEKDYNQEALYHELSPQTQEIVAKTAPHFDGRPTVVFAINIAHAEELSHAYNLAGVTSMALSAHTPKVIRKDVLDAWKSGAIQCVCNVALFTEGFDYTPLLPNRNGLGCVVIAAPTMSPSRYLQMVGRGTRLKPAQGDFTDCLVFDVGGNSNLLETKQITLPKVMPTYQENVFERDDFVDFDGKLEAEAEEEEKNKPKKPTLLRINDPMSTSWIAWGHNTMNDIYFTGLTSSSDHKINTYAVIIPSQRQDGLYKAYVLTETVVGYAYSLWEEQAIVERAKPLGQLMHHVNHLVASNGAKQLLDKKAKWRKEPATEKQIDFLASQSPKYYAIAKQGGWNKGEVASILNWVKLMPHLKKLVQSERSAVV